MRPYMRCAMGGEFEKINIGCVKNSDTPYID